jgi:MraZ protein
MDNLKLSFTGEYTNSLDQKHRLSIPVKFRKALDPVNDRTFVITRGFDPCLILYAVSEWTRVEEQLSQLSSIRGKHRNFVRSIVRHATYLQYDSQGRIAIPENLLEFASVKKDVNVIGMINKIELWAPEILGSQDATTDVTATDFEDLANEINF